MDDLGELFGVLRELGFVRRESPPIATVPEASAMIYVDVKSCWALPSWKNMALLFGLCHGWPRTQIKVVAGAYLTQAPPWFDAWIARAKATPMELIAERRKDGAGAIIWREPPTRASVFARLGQLTDSAPAPRPSPWQAVAGAADPAHAWTALANAGLIPAAWTNEPRRRFHHYDETPCSNCGGTGVGLGYGETSCYAGCSRGYFYTDRWEPFPASIAQAATIADDVRGVERFEALAYDLIGRAAPWHAKAYDAAGHVFPWTPAIVRWTLFQSSKPTPQVPFVLEPVWRALQIAVPEAALAEISAVIPIPGWSEQGARAWATASARGQRIPQHWAVPPLIVGRTFAELGDPFVTAREIESMPYRLYHTDPSAVDLWAYERAPH